MIVEPDFLNHWKTRMLVLELNDKAAPCYLIALWAHCQLRKTSTFQNLSANALKAICGYDGDAGVLMSALKSSQFIEYSPNGTEMTVHGWAEVNAKLIANWTNGLSGGRPSKTHKKPVQWPTDDPPITQPKPTANPAGVHSEPNPTPPVSDKRREEKMEKKTETPLPPSGEVGVLFSVFWTEWPKKHDKVRAEKAWKRLSVEDQRAAMAALPKHRRSDQWQRGVIPHAATWINGKRWQDEVKADYAPAAPKAVPKPVEPPPPWLDGIAVIRALRQAKGDALNAMEKMTVLTKLRAFPKAAWSFLRPEEYNFFNALLKEAEKKDVTVAPPG